MGTPINTDPVHRAVCPLMMAMLGVRRCNFKESYQLEITECKINKRM